MSTRTRTPSLFRHLSARMSNRRGLKQPSGGQVEWSVALLRPVLRFVPALVFALAFIFSAPADAAPKYEANFASFAKANGYFAIKGYSFDNARASTGKSRGRGAVRFSAITIERAVDFRSPEMLVYYARGEIIPKVTIRFGEGSNIVFTMELKRVTIGGVSHGVDNSKKKPTELVTLTFEEVKWSARTPDGKTVKGSWQAEDGK